MGCPPPGDLPDPGIKLASLAWQVDPLPLNQPGKPLAGQPPKQTLLEMPSSGTGMVQQGLGSERLRRPHLL